MEITRRQFLKISCLGMVSLAAGCASAGTYSSGGPAESSGAAQTPSLERLGEAVLSGGPGKDGIPSIDEPVFVSVEEMDDLLESEDMVFVLDYGGEMRVYPQKVLVWHEIVNDEVSGERISVTYCPLTGSTVAFKGRAPGGDPLTFGTTGRLVNSNLLMYDRQTESEWPQILGRAIDGEMKGASLEEVPLVWTTWEQWKERGPEDALVLSTKTGYIRSYGRDPYGSYSGSDRGYYENRDTLFPVLAESERLEPKEVVVGVKTDDTQHAILKEAALDEGIWNLEFGDHAIVAVADPALETVWVFNRQLDGETLELRPGEDDSLLLDARGRAWSRKGLALEGPGGERLPAANFYEVMWFAWYAFYPETGLVS